MTKKDQQVYFIALAIVIVVAGVWIYKTRSTPETGKNPDVENQQQRTQNQGNIIIKEQAGNTWTGALKQSDNASKGSLMLVNAEHTIYLRTIRDFSSLVGKEVVVSYEGTLESFTLKNITAK